jgi:xanthine dehydrogenase accessory factor
MRSDLLAALNEERAGRRVCVLVTNLTTGEQKLVRAVEFAADPLAELLAEQVRLGKSAAVEIDGAQIFLTVQVPPVRLIVIGAVHISQALAPIAKLAGFDMTIIDPRTAFASPDRFPEVEVIAEWPQDVLPKLAPDAYTAMALLTHDPRIDDPGLEAALAAECFYIGALGSRKTHAKRLERLRGAGFKDTALDRIHAPIGLDIGAVSPAEIAVAILGEIIAALRKKPLRSEKAA